MKKLLVLTVIVSMMTFAGFWGGRKICMVLMWPAGLNPNQNWYYALGLNDEQANALREQEKSFRKDTDRLCMRICKERLELMNLMASKTAEPAVVSAKIEEIGALQILLEKEIAAHILEVKRNLTPEQSRAWLERIRGELMRSIAESGYGALLDESAPRPVQ